MRKYKYQPHKGLINTENKFNLLVWYWIRDKSLIVIVVTLCQFQWILIQNIRVLLKKYENQEEMIVYWKK